MLCHEKGDTIPPRTSYTHLNETSWMYCQKYTIEQHPSGAETKCFEEEICLCLLVVQDCRTLQVDRHIVIYLTLMATKKSILAKLFPLYHMFVFCSSCFEIFVFIVLCEVHLDQLAKPTFRSRYSHTPFGSAPVPILSS